MHSFDRFHTFIMSAGDYFTSRMSSTNDCNVEKPVLVTSTLGIFVRKCRLEYFQLDFDAANRLWELFTILVAPDHNISEVLPKSYYTEPIDMAQESIRRADIYYIS